MDDHGERIARLETRLEVLDDIKGTLNGMVDRAACRDRKTDELLRTMARIEPTVKTVAEYMMIGRYAKRIAALFVIGSVAWWSGWIHAAYDWLAGVPTPPR